MKASLFYLPTVGNRREIEAGMAGLRGDLYQQMLREVLEQVRLADELGYDTYNSLVPHGILMKSIERFWTEVMPRVA